MQERRQQLTLVLKDKNESIEHIRATFNPMQHHLVAALITVCREDELENLEDILENIESIRLNNPVEIEFENVVRFSGGKGVWITSKAHNPDFESLRTTILGKTTLQHLPHITLMHPRNSTCKNHIFEQITTYTFPKILFFVEIALIEQKNGGQWRTIKTFKIVK